MKKQSSIAPNVKKNKLIFLILLLVILFSFSRSFDYPLGEDSYLTLKIAKEFLKDPSIIIKDGLSFSSRFNPAFSLSEIFLAIISVLININVLVIAKIFSILISILILILFIIILKELKIENKISFLSVLLFILSPVFIYLISTISQNLTPLLFSILAFYLYLKSKYKALSFILFLFPLVNPLAALIVIILFIILIISKNKKQIYLLFPSFLTLIIYFIYLIYLSKFSSYFNPFQKVNSLSLIISDFGFNPGLSIFLLIASVYSLIHLWKKFSYSKQLYFAVIFLFILSFFSSFALFLLAPIASVLAAFGIFNLHNKKWISGNLKIITITALMFGIVLSSLTFVFSIETQLPDKELILSLKYLNENSPEDSVILSDPSRGHWINYFAERKNIADSNTFLAPQAKERLNDINEIFQTRDINKFNGIADKYKINYIFIDSELKKQLWNTDDEGLQFILKNNPNIVRFYKNDKVEIWKIIKI